MTDPSARAINLALSMQAEEPNSYGFVSAHDLARAMGRFAESVLLEPGEGVVEATRFAFIKTLQDGGCWRQAFRDFEVQVVRDATSAALRAAALAILGRDGSAGDG